MKVLPRYIMLFTMILVFAPLSVSALEIPEGVKVLTAPEVRQMRDNSDALLVHTLSRIEYRMQHIPESVNIPVDEVKHSPKMPANKNAPVIFYCNGTACPYSKRASKIAVKQGYTNVYWFQGGILEWRKFQYDMEVDKALSNIKISKFSPAKFRKMVKDNVLVLDVRPQWWRQSKEKAGVIEGTKTMIPLLKLDELMNLLPKDRPILVVDRLMRQSVHAGKFLKMNGYNILGVLKGGSKRWVAEGLPVLKEQDEPPTAGGI